MIDRPTPSISTSTAPTARRAWPTFRRAWRLILLAPFLAVFGRPTRADAILIFTPSGFVEDVVADNLPYATGIAFAPDGRMFITLKGGVVRVYQNGTLLPTPFIDITSQVSDSTDRGLLGVAVHPNFPTTPYVYLLFTWNPPGYSNIDPLGGRVSRLIRVEADPRRATTWRCPGATSRRPPPAVPGTSSCSAPTARLRTSGTPPTAPTSAPHRA
jgi:glucose/arabinose dehydrogenase